MSDSDLEIAYLFGDEGHLDYLFGDREVDILDHCLARFLILDTTATAAFIFAALCLLSITVGNMQTILRYVRSTHSFLADVLRFAIIRGAQLGHLSERLATYYRPGDQLGRCGATLHIIATLLAVNVAYAVFLKPAILYLHGFIGGWAAENGDLTVPCIDTFNRFINLGVRDLTEWNETCACFGEEGGISWHAWIQDWYTTPIKDDINHIPGIICALASLALGAWLYAVYIVAVWVNRYLSEPEPPDHTEDYKNLLGQYPGLVDQYASIIQELTDALEHGKEELARRSDALRIKEKMLQASWEANRRLSEVRVMQEEFREEFRSQTEPTKNELRVEVAKLTRNLELARREVIRVEQLQADTSRTLTKNVTMLQRKVDNRDEAIIASRNECASLRAHVQTREQQLVISESSLSDTKAALERAIEQSREKIIECDSLKASHDSLMAGYRTMQMVSKERDQMVASLEAELAAADSEAVDIFNQLQDLKLAAERGQHSNPHQDERTVLEAAISERCRAIELDATANARSQADAFARERADLQGQLEKATLGLQKSQTMFHQSQEKVSLLQDRLVKFEEGKDPDSQEIAPLIDVHAIQRALADSELTVAIQLSEIESLTKELRRLKE